MIKHLSNGRDLQDAKTTIQKTKVKANSVVYIVGSNDLAKTKSVSSCMVEVDKLINATIKTMGKDIDIAFSQILTRTDRDVFNRKAKDFNQRLYSLSRKINHGHIHYIHQSGLHDASSKYDGIHLKSWAVKQLVRNIKVVCNPLLGLPSYQNDSQTVKSSPNEVYTNRGPLNNYAPNQFRVPQKPSNITPANIFNNTRSSTGHSGNAIPRGMGRSPPPYPHDMTQPRGIHVSTPWMQPVNCGSTTLGPPP